MNVRTDAGERLSTDIELDVEWSLFQEMALLAGSGGSGRDRALEELRRLEARVKGGLMDMTTVQNVGQARTREELVKLIEGKVRDLEVARENEEGRKMEGGKQAKQGKQ